MPLTIPSSVLPVAVKVTFTREGYFQCEVGDDVLLLTVKEMTQLLTVLGNAFVEFQIVMDFGGNKPILSGTDL
jgi:hypothetical protein